MVPYSWILFIYFNSEQNSKIVKCVNKFTNENMKSVFTYTQFFYDSPKVQYKLHVHAQCFKTTENSNQFKRQISIKYFFTLSVSQITGELLVMLRILTTYLLN